MRTPCLALLAACGGEPAAPTRDPQRPLPDLVVVVVDTLRADALGVYGNALPTSPQLDRLAAEGTWFSRSYAHSGWTLASMTSLFTGQLPHVHRVGRSAFDPTAFGRLPDETETVAERLQARGYQTGAWLNNTFLAPEFGLRQGFQTWDWQGADNARHRSAAETVAAATAWLATQTGPVFMVVHLMEPHFEYKAPEGIRGTLRAQVDLQGRPPPPIDSTDVLSLRAAPPPTGPDLAYIRAAYDEEVLAADQALGPFFDALRARPRWSDTLVAVTADHGEELWDHGTFEHGHSLLGELTRVPLILGGGAAPRVGRNDTVVGHVDLSAALLALAGAEPVAGSPGEDLLALARAGHTPGRVAVSENTLYGPPRVSIVGDHHRLDVNQSTMRAVVVAVEADGSERDPVPQADQARLGEPLSARLAALRGGLDPVSAVPGPTLSSGEVFRQLEALGYLAPP
jgi:choline-sulfatase